MTPILNRLILLIALILLWSVFANGIVSRCLMGPYDDPPKVEARH